MVKTMSEYAIEKYQGAVASGYDAKRESQDKWDSENAIVEDMLKAVPDGSRVLDCPVGTGRFLPFYQKCGFSVLGLDINQDMLDEAQKKVTRSLGGVTLGIGDIRDIELYDDECDVAVCIRMFRWLELDDVKKALGELQRVSKKWVIFNARIANDPYARPMPLIMDSLLPDWWLELSEEIEPDYRMFRLRYDA